MDIIQLQHTLPQAFAGRSAIDSEVWHRQLTLSRGKSYLVEAASGTGKSSLCSYLYGYRNDYEGLILFDNENIRSFSPAQWTALRRQSLSLLFQELRIFPELTSLENVLLKNRLTGHKSRQEILALFEQLDIADKAGQKMSLLSYGQQQRVAFIRSLCQPFQFILLDEPISHLDDANATRMAEILQREAAAQGAGIITTSIGKHLPLHYDETLTL